MVLPKKGCCILGPRLPLPLLAPAIYSLIPTYRGRRGRAPYMTIRAFGFTADSSASFAAFSACRSAGVFAENTCQYMSLPVRRLTP